LWVLGAITDHSHIVVEGNDANSSVLGSVRHHVNLALDSGLHTLHPRHVGHALIWLVYELIRTVTEACEGIAIFLSAVALNIKFALDGFSHAHRSWNIETEDNWDILASDLLVLNLGCSLDQVADSFGLRLLFLIKHGQLICVIAEFTLPKHLVFLGRVLNDLGLEVHHSLTPFTDLRVACRHFSVFLEAVKGNLEDVGVNFNIVFWSFLLTFLLAYLLLLSFHENALLSVIFVVAHIQVAVEVVLVDALGR
jgi:hypothetical protein